MFAAGGLNGGSLRHPSFALEDLTDSFTPDIGHSIAGSLCVDAN